MISLLTLLHYAIWLYMIAVIVRVLLTWVNPDPWNPLVRFLQRATDPALSFIRRNIPLPRSAIDLSPILLIIGLAMIDTFILKTTADLSLNLPVSVTRNLLYAFVIAIQSILRIYMIIIIIRAVISWVNPDPYNFLVRAVYELTEPVLYRVRRMLPVSGGGFDFSPVIVIILIYAASSLLAKVVY
ncbi:MAG: YggT family protein [Deltaproteobacteria bacterium]|nr:YggT family protein [Deltaproteobacteria bacterium]